MKQFTLRVLLVLALAAVTLANGRGWGYPTPPPKHPECVGKQPGQKFKQSDSCAWCECDRNGQIGCVGCAASAPPSPNCRRVPGSDQSSYPGCCPKWDCPPPPHPECVGKQPGQKFKQSGSCSWCECDRNGQIACVGCPASPPPAENCKQVPGSNQNSYPGCCPVWDCPPPPHPECVDKAINQYFKKSDSCSRCKCDGEKQISCVSCAVSPKPAPNCRQVPGSNQNSYPGCCPVWDCPPPPHPECVDKAVNQYFKKSDSCSRCKCDGEKQISCVGCAASPKPSPNCRQVPGSNQNSYPGCCPVWDCPPPPHPECRYKPVNQYFKKTGSCENCKCDENKQISCVSCPSTPKPRHGCMLGSASHQGTFPECCPKWNCNSPYPWSG